MIAIHVLIALAGLIVTTLAYFSPTKGKLTTSYWLAALTFVTGTYLTIMAPAHLVQACITGIIYFSFVTFGIVAARKKFADERINR